MLVQLGALCLKILSSIGALVYQNEDPRLVLIQLDLLERFDQEVQQQKLTLALNAEVTGAHALSLSTFDELRRLPDYPGTLLDAYFAQPAERATGRTYYSNTAEVIAGWLGINYFEAQRRIDDAHLLIGRRTLEGSICEPRFEQLAALFASGTVDRRRIARVSRQLEKLEPEDTIFDGVPSPLQARSADGTLLETNAAQALADLSPVEARKHIDAEISRYKETHGLVIPPKLGFFIGRVIGGVHCFYLRTDATQAEVFHSVAAQSSNKRTKAGKAARGTASGQDTASDPEQESADQHSRDQHCGDQHSGDQHQAAENDGKEPTPPTPDWLISEQPMPPWAETQTAAEETAAQDADAEADTEVVLDEAAEKTAATENTDGQDADSESSASGQSSPDNAQDPSPAQRRLNALMAILVAPVSGAKRKAIVPKVLVYMWLSDLQNLAEAHGVSAHSVDIPPGELRKLLANAGIIPLVLGSNSQPLDMGRSQRFHKGAIRTAIMARDRGCIVPGCTTPPEKVEVDHYEVSWSEGGETSVRSGAGMCTNEHQQRHSEQIKVVNVDGLPHVVLPEHLDPEQKPRRNTYWGALQVDDCPTSNMPSDPPTPNNSSEPRGPETEANTDPETNPAP
ncbi:hypothetical protein AS038_02320 [Arthrobacter sp. NIO-1057]|nr:hypothetical protein AS038_02320 [Arthrobacter sp. NIO-1057]